MKTAQEAWDEYRASVEWGENAPNDDGDFIAGWLAGRDNLDPFTAHMALGDGLVVLLTSADVHVDGISAYNRALAARALRRWADQFEKGEAA